MKIDVVIPNYNGANLIKKNLSDVIKSFGDYKSFSIIIVDDGSDSEDVIKLRSVIDLVNMSSKIPVVLILKEKNGGFSSAVNTGVKNSNADLILLLNSDAAPYKGFLNPILERFKNDPLLFGVGCMDVSIEGKNRVERGRGIGYWKKGILRHKKGEVDKEDTFWISGGSSMVRRDLYEKFGGMDEIYDPFYWEDIDLSYRAQKAGYKIVFESKSKVEHRHDEGAIKKHFKNNKVTTIVYRNQFIFHWKNITDKKLIFSHLFWLPFHLLNAIIRNDKGFMKGFFLALNKMPDIIKRRASQKPSYKKPDKEIIK